MSRAALLPTVGDPFILSYWLSFYEKVWKDEVDQLYVRLSHFPWIPNVVMDYTRDLLNRTTRCTWSEAEMENHGPALTHLVNQCQQDLVVFVEEDSFTWKPGHFDAQFKLIESRTTDLVGSPRLSCSQPIWDATEAKYGKLENQPYGDPGPNWWPNGFFIRKADLLRTDMDFANHHWPIGERIAELNLEATNATGMLVGDTMVWMSIQLRALGLRNIDIPQYHSWPLDLELHDEGPKHLWDGVCPWVHVGSLSTTVVGGADQCFFAEPTAFKAYVQHLRDYCDSEPHSAPSTRREFRRRFAWIRLILESAWQYTHAISEWRDRYAQNLSQIPAILGLDTEYMARLQAAWREVIPW